MDVEDRQAEIQLVDSFISVSPAGTSWTKEIVAGLDCYCPLRDTPKLLICHIFAKNHPEVIFGIRKIIAVNHNSDGEKDAGTGGADDDEKNV